MKIDSYDFEPELNITPLVDIMLVLLAILMVAMPVVYFQESITLPSGTKNNMLTENKEIRLVITSTQEIKLNGELVQFTHIKNELLKFSNKNTSVFILADISLNYGYVMSVLKEVKQTGLTKVSLVTNGD